MRKKLTFIGDIVRPTKWKPDTFYAIYLEGDRVECYVTSSSGIPKKVGNTELIEQIVREILPTTDIPTGLEKIEEGWRLIGRNPVNYGIPGIDSVDFSISTESTGQNGAVGRQSVAFGENVRLFGTRTSAIGKNVESNLKDTLIIGQNVKGISTNGYSGGNLVVSDSNIKLYNNLYGNIVAGEDIELSEEGAALDEAIVYASLVVGRWNKMYAGHGSSAIGAGLLSGSSGVTIVGVANEDLTETKTNYLTPRFNNYGPRFIVGTGTINIANGKDVVRKNGFVVMSDGTASFPDLTIAKINNSTGKSAVTKEWVGDQIAQSGGGDMMSSMYDPTGVEGDAFDYNNFHNTPDINNPTITITNGGTVLGSFSLNQEDADSINLASLTTNVEDNLTSTSTTNALSANQGRILKGLIDGLTSTISSGINLQGGYNASTETDFPGGGNALKGNAWYITNAGTIRGEEFEPGDMLIANKDNASTSNGSDWIFIQTNIGQATETTPGHAKIATTAQAQAGTDDTNIMTAKKVKSAIEQFSQLLTASTSIDIVSGQIRTKAISGDVSIPANSVASTISSNAVTTAKIANKAVTYAKIQDVDSESLLGRHSTTNGVIQEIKLANNLGFEGDNLQVVWGTDDW